jgi:uncharacterized protein
VVFIAAVIAGMINSVAGGGSLVSFPALLCIGRDPIVANVTNTMALWPGSVGGMLGFRRELGDRCGVILNAAFGNAGIGMRIFAALALRR